MSKTTASTFGVVVAMLGIERIPLLNKPLFEEVRVFLGTYRAKYNVLEIIPTIPINGSLEMLLTSIATTFAPTSFGPLTRLSDVSLPVRCRVAVDVERPSCHKCLLRCLASRPRRRRRRRCKSGRHRRGRSQGRRSGLAQAVPRDRPTRTPPCRSCPSGRTRRAP